ncbi:MAG: hypothetical protein ACP5OZ_03965 [Candidatus Woesearchaeota archaeon]
MKDVENPIIARAIIELIGTPKKYLEETAHKIVDSLTSRKELSVLKKEFFEPSDKGKFFSTFCELEISFNDLSALMNFCIDYLPSSIEVLEPPNLNSNAIALTNFFNDLLAKLHTLDMGYKELTAQKKILEENMLKLLRNNVMITLREAKEPLEIETLSRRVGIPKEQLEPMLNLWIEEKHIVKQDSKYTLPELKLEKDNSKKEEKESQKK